MHGVAPDDSCELTILMPCLNEAETIEGCITKAKEYIARAGIAGEVLIADNGSSDGSPEIAARLGARVAVVDERGYGAALFGGIRAARGRYVVMADAYGSYDFSRIDGFVEKLLDGYDLVLGNRFRGGILPGAMPPHTPDDTRFLTCAIVAREASADAAQIAGARVRADRAFDIVERSCPGLFNPAGPYTDHVNTTFSRMYVNSDARLRLTDGLLQFGGWRPGPSMPVGKIDDILDKRLVPDCASLTQFQFGPRR